MERGLEQIAYLGIPGSFSYQAATAYFGEEANLNGKPTFNEVFKSVVDGEVNGAIVPIENTLGGTIYENYDLLDKYPVHIIDEHYLRIEHSLLVSPKLGELSLQETLAHIKKVYSHPEALKQCRDFFAQNPHIEAMAATDTANAARYVSDNSETDVAAIASRVTGDIYGLDSKLDNLEDDPQNFTRFLAISNKEADRGSANKCSLVLHLKHEPGTLLAGLKALTDNKCDVTNINTRPWRGKAFEYAFYLDFKFDGSSETLENALSGIRDNSEDCRVLGLYQSRRGTKA